MAGNVIELSPDMNFIVVDDVPASLLRYYQIFKNPWL